MRNDEKSAETTPLRISEQVIMDSNDWTQARSVTPLPKLPLTIVLICLLADALSITCVYPLAPYMIRRFFNFSPKEQSKIGQYAGALAAAYTIGQAISSPFWGSWSDKIGRRPCILIGMVLNVICLVLFGTSSSYRMALGARFTQGLASDIPVIKTYIIDLTDSTNESRAFSFIGLTFGIGITFGPALGGLLYDPAESFPSLFSRDSLCGIYPQLLPVAVIAFKIFVDFVVALFFLPETTTHSRSIDDPSKDDVVPGTPREVVREIQAFLGETDVDEGPAPCVMEQSGWQRLKSCRNFRLTCAIQMLVGLCCFAFWEVLPVWASYSKEVGGIHFGPADTGSMQSIAGIFILLSSIVIFPRLCDKFGALEMYRVAILLLLIAIPVPTILTSLYLDKTSDTTWVLLLFSMLVYSMGNNFAFTSTSILLKKSIPPEYRGLGMGVSTTLMNIGYSAGPLLGGILFSFILTLPPPFNHGRLYFFVIELLLLWALRIWYNFEPLPSKSRGSLA